MWFVNTQDCEKTVNCDEVTFGHTCGYGYIRL